MEDVLKIFYCKSPLGFDKIDWFVNKVINLENEMAFYFKNTKKVTIVTEKDDEDYTNKEICQFFEKKY